MNCAINTGKYLISMKKVLTIRSYVLMTKT